MSPMVLIVLGVVAGVVCNRMLSSDGRSIFIDVTIGVIGAFVGQGVADATIE